MRRIAHSWLKAEKWQHTDYAKSLSPVIRSLILSTRSLTYELEALYGASVEVELKQVGYRTIEPELAEYMGIPAGCKGFEREVWLIVGGRRLVYAVSIFSIKHTEERLISILKEAQKPMGRVFVEENIPFEKEALEIATEIKDNKQFEFPVEDGLPVARRYRFSRKDKDGRWFINGAVAEVFSPELLQFKKER